VTGAVVKVLLADDSPDFRHSLAYVMAAWGYDCVEVNNGVAAWKELQQVGAPKLALLDWMMPGLRGPEVCRKVREMNAEEPPYLILLTARNRREDILAGLGDGADDYMTKPVDFEELRERLRAGRRVVELQGKLANRVRELADALARVKLLQGLLPICAWCKKIRDDHNYWLQVEEYISAHSEATFTHGICPDCCKRVEEET
jgi:DNA-binding response OmpR family regulator